MWVAARVTLAGLLLQAKGDRVAMNSSVEVRYPFLDEDVFDFTARLHPRWKLHGFRDKHLLRLMRIVVLCFTALVLVYALNSTASIFQMVESAYKVTLVCCFVPLAFGVYWKRSSSLGGTLSVFGGLIVWLACEAFAPDAMVPPQLAGLIASIAGMVVGSLLQPASARRQPPEQQISTI